MQHCFTKLPGLGLVELLTPGRRDREILLALMGGKSNKQIAGELITAVGCQLTEGTVKMYVNRLICTIGVHNRYELAIWAMTNPEVFHGYGAPAGIHPRGCGCPSRYCSMMREASAPIAPAA